MKKPCLIVIAWFLSLGIAFTEPTKEAVEQVTRDVQALALELNFSPPKEILDAQIKAEVEEVIIQYPEALTFAAPEMKMLISGKQIVVDDTVAAAYKAQKDAAGKSPMAGLVEFYHTAFLKGSLSPLQKAIFYKLTASVGAPTKGQADNTGQVAAKEASHRAYEGAVTKVLENMLATPIEFYGKVVDEKDNPVADADVVVTFADSFDPNENKHAELKLKSDANGGFRAKGHGLGIVVMVSKKGYYRLDKSDGQFRYFAHTGHTDPHPDPAKPGVLVLRKAGNVEPLIAFKRNVTIAKDGTPVELSLATGKAVPAGTGDIKVETWTRDEGHTVNSNVPYDWRCRISAPGGGLLPRAGEFDFMAPAEGYAPADEIKMPATLNKEWRDHTKREYFVKLANGTYARIAFEMIAGGDHFFVFKSFLNPKSGSRNLENGTPEMGSKP